MGCGFLVDWIGLAIRRKLTFFFLDHHPFQSYEWELGSHVCGGNEMDGGNGGSDGVNKLKLAMRILEDNNMWVD